ncbi:MAG: GGDEF domain-containing protein [Candidatus Eremiobacteraeota bacterium]|nr:GGDEF domain-containing protein [Candidatus Eremiobacteraeota bacterium]
MPIPKDNLTGFYSEAVLDEMLELEILREERYKRNLTLLMFQFEIPKRFQTDMYFPIFKRISKEIAGFTRRLDLKFRMKNRVLILLPETDDDGAKKAAVKVKENLEAVEFYHDMSDEYFHIKVYFSVGLYPKNGTKPDDLLAFLNDKLIMKRQSE